MADNRYPEGRPGHQGRGDSIFDDEHERRERGGPGEGHGLFHRAGEEVRSWFASDDERDPTLGQGARGHHGENSRQGREPWGGGSDWSGGGARSEIDQQGWSDDMGRGSFSQTSGGGSPFDDSYRSWREKRIEELDREYDEYRQHRQQQFESDFANWRENRQNPGPKGLNERAGATGGIASSASGGAGASSQGKGPRERKS